jgi:starvation-inducible outer membrane lipoprotein
MKGEPMKLIVLIGIICLMLSGCASPELIKFDDQNMANSIIAAQQIKKNWPANSAFIKVAVVGIQEPVNAELYTAIVALDKITARPDPMTQNDVGETLAWFGRFSAAGVQKLYEKIYPIVMKIVAAAGG